MRNLIVFLLVVTFPSLWGRLLPSVVDRGDLQPIASLLEMLSWGNVGSYEYGVTEFNCESGGMGTPQMPSLSFTSFANEVASNKYGGLRTT